MIRSRLISCCGRKNPVAAEHIRMNSENVNLTALPRSSIRDLADETELAQSLRAALANGNPVDCQVLAVRAGETRDLAAVPFLGGVLGMKRRRWAGARLAAVDALGQIGAEHALPALARACLDPAPDVQQTASDILAAYGAEALPALNAVLNQSGDWPLSGMKRLVETIGRLQTQQAAGTLVAVVLAGLPPPPPRWDRPLLYSIRLAVTIVMGGALTWLMITGSPLMGMAALFLLTIAVVFVWFVTALFAILPYHALREASERNAIAMLAAEGLRLSGDKAFLPAVIEGAFGYNRMSPRPARRALRYLLPRVDSEDMERLPFGARSKLMDALGRGHDADMDVAILGALEWVGTGSAADKVARLAEHGATPAVREEAARILPTLQARQRQEQAPAILLRPSRITSPATQLLRPGQYVETTPTEQLLRPGDSE